MGTRAERRAARDRVGAYHEAQLTALLARVVDGVDRYRAGQIDAYTLDETIHHYHRSAQELWKFCFSGGGGVHVELIAHLLDEQDITGETFDWWERGTPRRRR